jgi:CheY-like chemotaxis protein
MEDEARGRVVQWLEAAPSALDILSRLVDEQGRLRHAMEAAERECALLREELAAIRAENDRLVKVGREIDELIVNGLGKARDALLRVRGPRAEEVERKPPRRILIVDDDANYTRMITDYLVHHLEHEVLTAANGEEALTLLPRFQPHVVLLDLAMPGGGTWAIERIKALHPDLCVIVVTGNDDVSLARRARALGAADYVVKPFDLDDLGAVLDVHVTSGDRAPAPRPLTLV